MVDLSKIKSAQVIGNGDDLIIHTNNMNDEMSKKAPPRNLDPLQTQYRSWNGGLGVMKRNSNALILNRAGVTPDTLKQACASVGLPWIDDYAQRAASWYASDERPDRHGDIVEQSWVFDDFKMNPVMLFSHEWGLPPVGNIVSYGVENRKDNAGGYTGDALALTGVFATADMWDWADTICRLTLANMLRAGSVGFYPGEAVWIADNDERMALGLGPWGYVYRRNSLIEWSPTSVPANQAAIQTMMQHRTKGLFKSHDITAIREIKRREIIVTGKSETEWRSDDRTLVMFWKSMFPNLKVSEHKEMGLPIISEETSETVSVSFADVEKMHKTLTDKIDNLAAIVDDVRTNQEKSGAGPVKPPIVEVPKTGEVKNGDDELSQI